MDDVDDKGKATVGDDLAGVLVAGSSMESGDGLEESSIETAVIHQPASRRMHVARVIVVPHAQGFGRLAMMLWLGADIDGVARENWPLIPPVVVSGVEKPSMSGGRARWAKAKVGLLLAGTKGLDSPDLTTASAVSTSSPPTGDGESGATMVITDPENNSASTASQLQAVRRGKQGGRSTRRDSVVSVSGAAVGALMDSAAEKELQQAKLRRARLQTKHVLVLDQNQKRVVQPGAADGPAGSGKSKWRAAKLRQRADAAASGEGGDLLAARSLMVRAAEISSRAKNSWLALSATDRQTVFVGQDEYEADMGTASVEHPNAEGLGKTGALIEILLRLRRDSVLEALRRSDSLCWRLMEGGEVGVRVGASAAGGGQ